MIIHGDALTELRKLPSESVHCCITSPPYWGLRDYGIADQLGLEKTPEEYVARMVEVFREVKRVLRKNGTLWIVLGDSYAAGGRGGGTAKQDSNRGGLVLKGKVKKAPPGLKPKDLVGIPWRCAFALQADGWYLRSDIIWAKPNPMPESVRDRPTRSHEYIFLLSKSAKYYFDQEAVREPVCEVSLKRAEYGWDCDRPSTKNNALGNKDGIHTEKMGVRFVNPNGRNIRSVWTITTKPMPKVFGHEHFATFPPELPERCIKAGCPVGGIVLDPFFGAGTTGMIAKQLSRDFIGIELKKEYCEMAEKRISQVAYQMEILV